MVSKMEQNRSKFQSVLDEAIASTETVTKMVGDLIHFPTENPPVRDYEIQKYLRDFLRSSGLKVDLHNPGTTNAVALTSYYGEDNSKNGGNTLILYGHADVVPAGEKDRWKFPPFGGKRVGDRIYGRGASDMKAGLAAAVLSLKMLSGHDVKIPGKVELISVLDEENWHPTPVGWNTSDWLIQTGKLIGKACIMGEPTSISKICVGERGDYWVKLKVRAEPRHGSTPIYEENACVALFEILDKIHDTIENAAVNPLKEARTLINKSASQIAQELNKVKSEKLKKEVSEILKKYSMNVGVVSGGTMINSVPENCEALIAFCVPLGGTKEELHSKITKVLKSKKCHGVELELELQNQSQSNPSFTSPDSKLVRTLSDAARSTIGMAPSVYVTQGTSDANVFRKHGIDTCSYGPGTWNRIHGYDESVSIKDTISTLVVYLKTIANYFHI
jgi:succinyl-diaminopimelate desuccinylase